MANAKKKVVIFGTGIIGGEAIRQFPQAGYDVSATFNSRCRDWHGDVVEFTKRGNVDEMIDQVEILLRNDRPALAVFALPSGGENAAENERRLVLQFILNHIPVVSAGKASMSAYPEIYESYLPTMGINAMVSGATRILEEMQRNLRFDQEHPSKVELELNGTLSYIMSGIWAGRPLETVVREAVALKFAEPGVNGNMPDPLDIFKGEAEGDVKKKLLIILNVVYKQFIGRFVRPEEIEINPISRQGMMDVTDSNVRKKFVVRIATSPSRLNLPHDSPGRVSANIDDRIFVSGGFVDIPMGSAMDTWITKSGPGNAVNGVQDGRGFLKKADGAGALATVSTLLYDAFRLCPPN